MAENPKRRLSDRSKLPFNGYWLSLLKAVITTCVLGVIGFVGSWGIDTSKSLAQLHDEVGDLKEKQDMLGPWMIEEIKGIRADLEKTRATVEQIQIDLARRRP